MIDGWASLALQFFHIAIAKRETQIPAHRHEDYLGLKLPPLELLPK